MLPNNRVNENRTSHSKEQSRRAHPHDELSQSDTKEWSVDIDENGQGVQSASVVSSLGPMSVVTSDGFAIPRASLNNGYDKHITQLRKLKTPVYESDTGDVKDLLYIMRPKKPFTTEQWRKFDPFYLLDYAFLRKIGNSNWWLLVTFIIYVMGYAGREFEHSGTAYLISCILMLVHMLPYLSQIDRKIAAILLRTFDYWYLVGNGVVYFIMSMFIRYKFYGARVAINIVFLIILSLWFPFFDAIPHWSAKKKFFMFLILFFNLLQVILTDTANPPQQMMVPVTVVAGVHTYWWQIKRTASVNYAIFVLKYVLRLFKESKFCDGANRSADIGTKEREMMLINVAVTLKSNYTSKRKGSRCCCFQKGERNGVQTYVV